MTAPDNQTLIARLREGTNIINYGDIMQQVADALEAAEKALAETYKANDDVGRWLSAALDDQKVCPEMKADITIWFAMQP